jgi:hypothetical protein
MEGNGRVRVILLIILVGNKVVTYILLRKQVNNEWNITNILVSPQPVSSRRN